MRRFVVFLMAVFAWCCGCGEPKAPVAHDRLDVLGYTVALVNSAGKPYCAGVWVGDRKVLTASHCVIDDDTDTVQPDATVMTRDGVLVLAHVDKTDRRRDLALLDVLAAPVHASAKLASSWSQGETLSIVGHPGGEKWIWTRGFISGWDMKPSPESEDKMSMLRIQSPIWFGNSGGGAFDESGALVGIASMLSTRMPDVGWFVAPDEIAAFLATP